MSDPCVLCGLLGPYYRQFCVAVKESNLHYHAIMRICIYIYMYMFTYITYITYSTYITYITCMTYLAYIT